MKRNTFKSCFFFLSFILILLPGCNNIVDNTSSTQSDSSKNEEVVSTDGELAYITLGNISLSNYTAARDIFPSEDDLDKSNLQNISLTGVWGSTPKTLIAEKDEWSVFSNFIYPDGLAIQTGSWTFTISAEMNGIEFTGIIDENKDGVNDTITITKGTMETLNFVLKPTSETCGGLNITVNITNASDNFAQTALVTLTDLSGGVVGDEEELTVTGGSVSFVRNLSNVSQKIQAGDYYINFSFKSSDDTLPVLNVLKEKVIIVAGITTTATKSIKIDNVYNLTYETNDPAINIDDYDPVKIYTRKSSTITLPVLSRTGYSFGGWYANDAFSGSQITSLPSPSVSDELYAKWIPNEDTQYIVNHWMQKVGGGTAHNDSNYELIDGVSTENKTGKTAQTVSITAKDTTTGDYLGFIQPTSAELTTAGAITIAADGSTVVDLYYNRNTYTVTYADGVTEVINVPDSEDVQYGQDYTVLFTPVGTREGYVFGGWSDGTNTYKEGDTETLTIGADDVILTAIWLPPFAIVNGTTYYTLADAQAAIRTATGDITVVLTSAVKQSDIRIDGFNPNSIVDSNTISDALRNTTASSVSLSVKTGDTIELTGDCSYLFLEAQKLKSIDLTGFDTTNATYIYGMFDSCYALTSLDLSSFNTSNVTNMMGLFGNCFGLKSIKFGANFDTSNATSMHAMFSNCSKLQSLDLSGFDTSKADSFTNMFTNCKSLTQLDISSFTAGTNTPNALSMFSGCTNLETIIVSDDLATYLSGLSSSDANNMFKDCSKLVGANCTAFNSSKIDNTYARFDVSGTPGYFTPASDYAVVNGVACNNLSATITAINNADKVKIVLGKNVTADDIGNCQAETPTGSIAAAIWSKTDITDAEVYFTVRNNANILLNEDSSKMFFSCKKIKSLDLSGFNTSNVTNMDRMFNLNQALTSINLSNFNTDNVITMQYLFCSCIALTSVNLSSFNTNNGTYLMSMFYDCTALTTIKASDSFVITDGTDTSNMFGSCSQLVGGAGTTFNESKVDGEYARIDKAGSPGYFTAAD